MFLCLAVLVEHRLVTDRQTDRHTDGQTHDHGIYRESIARAVKNECYMIHVYNRVADKYICI